MKPLSPFIELTDIHNASPWNPDEDSALAGIERDEKQQRIYRRKCWVKASSIEVVVEVGAGQDDRFPMAHTEIYAGGYCRAVEETAVEILLMLAARDQKNPIANLN